MHLLILRSALQCTQLQPCTAPHCTLLLGMGADRYWHWPPPWVALGQVMLVGAGQH